jgi:hypothetical protein
MPKINIDLFYKVEGYCFRPLLNAGELHLAEKLLYDCYITEQHWNINPKNPSNIKTKTCKKIDCHCLTDFYCDKAYWFGAFKEEILIGCFRVLKYPCTELGRYINLPSWLTDQHPYELNRLAIHQNFRHHKIITLMLLRVSFDYAFKSSNTAYVTASRSKLAQLYVKMGLLNTGIFFKYDQEDTEEVELLYAEVKDKSNAALYKITDTYIQKNISQPHECADKLNKSDTNEPKLIMLDPNGEKCPLNIYENSSLDKS